MIRSAVIYIILSLIVTISACKNDTNSYTGKSGDNIYKNPVYPSSLPDPNVIRAQVHFFLILTAESLNGAILL